MQGKLKFDLASLKIQFQTLTMYTLLGLLTEASTRTFKNVQYKVKRMSEIEEEVKLAPTPKLPRRPSLFKKDSSKERIRRVVSDSGISPLTMSFNKSSYVTSQYVETDLGDQLEYIYNLEEEIIVMNKRVKQLKQKCDLQENQNVKQDLKIKASIQMDNLSLMQLFNYEQKVFSEVALDTVFQRVILVVGERQSGKTHLIQELIMQSSLRIIETGPYQGIQGYIENDEQSKTKTLYIELSLDDHIFNNQNSLDFSICLMLFTKYANHTFLVIEKLNGSVMQFINMIAFKQDQLSIIHNIKSIVDNKTMANYKQEIINLFDSQMMFINDCIATDQKQFNHIFRYHGSKTINNIHFMETLRFQYQNQVQKISFSQILSGLVDIINVTLNFLRIEVNLSIKATYGAYYLIGLMHQNNQNMYTIEQRMYTTYLDELLNLKELNFQSFESRFIQTSYDEDDDSPVFSISLTSQNLKFKKMKSFQIRNSEFILEGQLVDKRFNKILEIRKVYPMARQNLAVCSVEFSGSQIIVLGLQSL